MFQYKNWLYKSSTPTTALDQHININLKGMVNQIPSTNQPVRSKVRDLSPTHTWYWREELEDVFLFDTWEGGGWKSQVVLMCMLSLFSRVGLFVTPWTVADQAPLSVGFSRQEYWSWLSCPPPGDLPNPGIEPRSPALQTDSWPSEPPGKPRKHPYSKCLLLALSPRSW